MSRLVAISTPTHDTTINIPTPLANPPLGYRHPLSPPPTTHYPSPFSPQRLLEVADEDIWTPRASETVMDATITRHLLETLLNLLERQRTVIADSSLAPRVKRALTKYNTDRDAQPVDDAELDRIRADVADTVVFLRDAVKALGTRIEDLGMTEMARRYQ